MEESKAIHRLVEVQDLVGMVEDMLAADMVERLSPAAWSGIRITLRNVRETIGASHGAMATGLVQRAKTSMPQSSMHQSATMNPSQMPMAQESKSSDSSTASAQAASRSMNQMSEKGHEDIRINPPLSRRDLKASLERLVDRQ